jgi:putative transposase
MVNNSSLIDTVDRLPLTAAGRNILDEMMSGAPVRQVQSRGGNVVTSFFSQKMSCEILTEAMSTEFPLGQEKERDSNVLGYWVQAYRFHLAYPRNGKTVRTTHVPDYFSIEKFPARAVLEEVKTEQEWLRLSHQHPGWIVKEGDRWRNPTLEAHFEREFGFEYRLRSSVEFPQRRVANYSALAAFYSPNASVLTDSSYAALRAEFADQSFVALKDLVGSGLTVDEVYKAIADGLVAFDLDHDDIDDTQNVNVYRDQRALSMFRQVSDELASKVQTSMLSSLVPGSRLVYDGTTYVVRIVGTNKATLVAEHGSVELSLTEIVEMLRSERAVITDGGEKLVSTEPLEAIRPLTESQLESAYRKLAAIRFAEDHPGESPVPLRTLQNWQKIQRDAGPYLGDQLRALAPKTRNCGNRTERLHPALVSAFSKTIAEHNSVRAPNGASSYREYCLLCLKAEQRPISRSAFYKKLKKVKSIRKREGRRRAYQTDPIVAYLEYRINVHGTRPMQAVHIDHTPIDVELVDATGEISMRSAWLTLAMDAASRAVVGFVLSFEPPSYRSCMMVLRDIVRRLGRVPDMLVLDNGDAFHSNALLRVCSLYQIMLRYRPPAQPRTGSVMERLFGTTTTELFNNLEGNKELLKHFRSVTKSVQPKNHARWTLPAMHGALDFFYSRLYGKENHPAHGEPPVQFFERRLTETGQRATRLVKYDRTFLIETCPSVKPKGTRKVDNQRGVKVGWVWYWCDAFRRPNEDKKSVPIRVDPWDPRHVYALVDDQWELCRSKLVGALHRMTATELRYAFETIENASGVQKNAYTREILQDWADVLRPENFDPRIRLEQQEMAYVFEPLKMTSVEFATHGQAADALLVQPVSPSSKNAEPSTQPKPDKPTPVTTKESNTCVITINQEEQIETF